MNPLPLPTTISVTAPDTGWRVWIERVLERDKEVWILVQLNRPPGPAAQMIHQAKAEIPMPLPNKPIRVFVAGKTWNWANEEPYEFVVSLETVARQAGDARVLYASGKK